jgi:ABC-2 type transport system permease protein
MRGLVTVFIKELADYLTSWRGIILFVVVILAAVFAIYGPSGAFQNIRSAVSSTIQSGATQFIFLNLFTVSGQGSPSFLYFVAMFLVPILGIALGFDAINSEKNSGTLGRLLSQPIYRDAVFNGKFLAGIAAIAIMLTSIIILISGLGLNLIGVPPSSEEALRIFLFLGLAILYGAFWLGLAMLFSVFLPRVATSALAPIAVWIFFLFFQPMIVNYIATQVQNPETAIIAWRGSPLNLFWEAMSVLLVPGQRTMSEILQLQSTSGFVSSRLSMGQSLLTIWPHLVTLVAITAVCLAISYTKFMREEIRST